MGPACSACATRDVEHEMNTGGAKLNGDLNNNRLTTLPGASIANALQNSQEIRLAARSSAQSIRKQLLSNSAIRQQPRIDVALQLKSGYQDEDKLKSSVERDSMNEDANTDSNPNSEEDDQVQDQIFIDDVTMTAIIKFQALVRGYLTRKLIYEHLQQIVSQQNQAEFDQCDNSEEQPQQVLRASIDNRFSGKVLDNDLIVVKEAPYEEEGCSTEGADMPDNEIQGQYTFQNGAVYQGQWKDRQRHGYGVQVWPDGARYEGEWQFNQAFGKGVFYHVDGDIFDGQWEYDKANGFGTYYNANGSKYEGQWVDDLQDGEGQETWQDGSTYQGCYKKGQKHGQGLYVWSDGSVYNGQWVSNKIQGIGTYKWADGRYYEGEWLENKMHGNGHLTWPNGRSYQGDFLNDMKHGQGTYTWADGQKYIGEWQSGKQHGNGVHIAVDGSFRRGIWNKGKREQWRSEIIETSNCSELKQ